MISEEYLDGFRRAVIQRINEHYEDYIKENLDEGDDDDEEEIDWQKDKWKKLVAKAQAGQMSDLIRLLIDVYDESGDDRGLSDLIVELVKVACPGNSEFLEEIRIYGPSTI